MATLVVEFSNGGGTKLERFLPKNQHTQRKLLKFENWKFLKSIIFLLSFTKLMSNDILVVFQCEK